MTKRLRDLPQAGLPIDANRFFVIGIDPTTNLGSQIEASGLPFTTDPNRASIQELSQTAYDALTPEQSTLYVVDSGESVYFGGLELSLLGTAITIPVGGAYVDTGFDTDINTKFGWRFELRSVDDLSFSQAYLLRTQDLFGDPSFSHPSVGDNVSRRTTLWNVIASLDNNGIIIPDIQMSIDSSGNILFGLSRADNAQEIIIREAPQEYVKTDYLDRATLSVPDTNFVATGITLPDNGIAAFFYFSIGTSSTFTSLSINPEHSTQILGLTRASAGESATSSNAFILPFGVSTPTGSGRIVVGITSSNEILLAVAPSSLIDNPSYVERPFVLGSTDLSGSDNIWFARVWRTS